MEPELVYEMKTCPWSRLPSPHCCSMGSVTFVPTTRQMGLSSSWTLHP